MFSKIHKTLPTALLLIVLITTGCASRTPASTEAAATGGEVKLTLGAYTTPREAYAEVIPLFQAYWLEKSGQKVTLKKEIMSKEVGIGWRAALNGGVSFY